MENKFHLGTGDKDITASLGTIKTFLERLNLTETIRTLIEETSSNGFIFEPGPMGSDTPNEPLWSTRREKSSNTTSKQKSKYTFKVQKDFSLESRYDQRGLNLDDNVQVKADNTPTAKYNVSCMLFKKEEPFNSDSSVVENSIDESWKEKIEENLKLAKNAESSGSFKCLSRLPSSSNCSLQSEEKQVITEHIDIFINEVTEFDKSAYDDLKEKFKTLQEEHQKLMSVAAELTIALQTNVIGQTENLHQMLSKCKAIYPDLFAYENMQKGKTGQNKMQSSSIEKTEQVVPFYRIINDENTAGQHFVSVYSTTSTSTAGISAGVDVNSKKTKEMNEKPAIIPESQHENENSNVRNVEISKEKWKDEITSHLAGDCKSKIICKTYFELDYQKVKKDLITGSADTKINLMQSLKWRITKSSQEIRTQAISSYVRHDLLEIEAFQGDKSYLIEMFSSPANRAPQSLQQSAARLLNAMASLRTGRDYLARSTVLLRNILLPLVDGFVSFQKKFDNITQNMVVATLQKLSLRNSQRVVMIQERLVESIVWFLAETHGTLSGYCLEYTTALLMNLCLHPEAKERCESIAHEVVQLLSNLMQVKFRSCLPYVNGVTYSLLCNPYILYKAKRMKLDESIRKQAQNEEGEMKIQLEYILMLFDETQRQLLACDCEKDSEEEADIVEPELDHDDQISSRLAAGEDLLYQYRLIFPRQSSQVVPSALTCFCRPVTPRVSFDQPERDLNNSSPKRVGIGDKLVNNSPFESVFSDSVRHNSFSDRPVTFPKNYDSLDDTSKHRFEENNRESSSDMKSAHSTDSLEDEHPKSSERNPFKSAYMHEEPTSDVAARTRSSDPNRSSPSSSAEQLDRFAKIVQPEDESHPQFADIGLARNCCQPSVLSHQKDFINPIAMPNGESPERVFPADEFLHSCNKNMHGNHPISCPPGSTYMVIAYPNFDNNIFYAPHRHLRTSLINPNFDERNDVDKAAYDNSSKAQYNQEGHHTYSYNSSELYH